MFEEPPCIFKNISYMSADGEHSIPSGKECDDSSSTYSLGLDSFLEKYSFPSKWNQTLYAITSADIAGRKFPASEDAYAKVFIRQAHNSMRSELNTEDIIPPVTTDYNRDGLPDGWQQIVSPQGRLYFWNESCRTLTGVDLYYPELLERVTEAINMSYHELYNMHRKAASHIPTDSQLVLDIFKKSETGEIVIGYYFASLEKRCLFWLRQQPLSKILRQGKTVGSKTRIRYIMEAEYWLHHFTFPDVQDLSDSLVEELRGLILYAGVDRLHNPMTTFELGFKEIQECIQYIGLLGTKVPNRKSNPNVGYTAWAVGILMHYFAQHKFVNFHGQKNVRWRRDQELAEGSVSRRSILLTLLSPALFYGPRRYFFALRNAIVKDKVFSEPWLEFVRELHAEWQRLILIAVILLTSNIAFLGIQAVAGVSDHRSVEQILSYISTIGTIGSILLSQFITACHQLKGWEAADARANNNFGFLMSLGINTLSIIYSLPYAALIWAIVALLAAFLTSCFANSNMAIRISVGTVFVLFAAAFVGCGIWAEGNDINRNKKGERRLKVWNSFKDILGRRPSAQQVNLTLSLPPYAV